MKQQLDRQPAAAEPLPAPPGPRSVATSYYLWRQWLSATAVGRLFSMRQEGFVVKSKARSILRPAQRGADGKRSKDPHAPRVQWRAILAGTDEAIDQAELDRLKAAQAKSSWIVRVELYYKLLRLPTLTYEQLAVPLRLAFPIEMLSSRTSIALDALVDLFELGLIAYAVLREFELYASWVASPTTAAAAAADGKGGRAQAPYTLRRLGLDLLTVGALAATRFIYLVGGPLWPWFIAQLPRLVRIRDLSAYMAQLNADLTTNVTFYAIFKFSLVVISVPHWVGCVWWILGERSVAGGSFSIPSWTAQYSLASGVPDRFEPTKMSAVERYLVSQYMSWSGVTSTGYGSITLISQPEIWFGCTIILVQIVFYAFVLGTLFHYLVRTDENTVKFKEILKAVEEYGVKRHLPPTVARKMQAHFEFQHRKHASSTEVVFQQLPLSLRLRVASAQYKRVVEVTWIFGRCNLQFLDQLVMVLRERYVMPLEMLFDRGDGSRELLWCVSGTLHVRKGEQHIATVRSDLGSSPIVGEIAFILGIVQPYTVSATDASEVTLLVLSVTEFDETITSYPEQADVVLQNLLRHFALSKNGDDLAGGQEPTGESTMTDDEREEWMELRSTVRQALLDRNDEALTQMTYAASEGDVDAVRALAARGLNLDAGDYDNRTTLHLAAAEGNARVVALLCQLGAKPDVQDRWGNVPMKDAIEGKHDAVLEVLRQQGVSLDVQNPAQMLCAAVDSGDLERLNKLIEYGISANLGDYDSRTPLHLAAAAGNMRVVEFLVAKLADVSAQDRNGNTPVDDAIHSEHALVTQLLVRSGSRPNPLRLLASLCEAAASGDVGMVRFLVETGVAINSGDYDGRTALHLACAGGSISTTHYLIGAMADVNAKDRWGNTPLVDALWTSNECAALLAQQCGATLPAQYDHDLELQALYAAAKVENMYSLNRKLNTRGARRRRLLLLRRDRSRELRLAFKGLMDELGLLYRASRPLFVTLHRTTDRWIENHAFQVESDEDSDTDLSDSDVDSASECSGPAQRRSAVPAASRLQDDAPAAVLDESSKGKLFVRLALRLARADEAFDALARLFAEHLSRAKLETLPAAARLKAEWAGLNELLQHKFGLPADMAAVCVDEIHADLLAQLGSAAPRRPGLSAQPAHGAQGVRPAGNNGRLASVFGSGAKNWLKLSGGERELVGTAASSPIVPKVERTSYDEDSQSSCASGQPGTPPWLSPNSPSGSFRPATPEPVQSRVGIVSEPRSLRPPGALDETLFGAIKRTARKSFERVMHGSDRGGGGATSPSEASDAGGAAEDLETAERVWVSEIGHVALFCSPTFMSILSKRVVLDGGSDLNTDRLSRGSGRLDTDRGGADARRSLPTDSPWRNPGGGGVASFLDRVLPVKRKPLPAPWGKLLSTPTLQQAAGVATAPASPPALPARPAPAAPPHIATLTLSAANLALVGAVGERSPVAAVGNRSCPNVVVSSQSELLSRPGGFGRIVLPTTSVTTSSAADAASAIFEKRSPPTLHGIALAAPSRQGAPADDAADDGGRRSVFGRLVRVSQLAGRMSKQPNAQGLSRQENSPPSRPPASSPPRLRKLLQAADGSASATDAASRLSNATRANKVIAALARKGSAPRNLAAALAASIAKAAANREAVAPCAELLEGLWSVFNVSAHGAVQVKEIRALQTSLGEMGGLEIKSLMSRLAVASAGLATAIERVASLNFAAEFASSPKSRSGGAILSGSGLTWRGEHDDSQQLRRTRMLSRLEFAAGAIEWVRASALRDGDDDGVDAFASPSGAERDAEAGAPGVMPRLRLGGMAGEQPRKQQPDTKTSDDEVERRSADGSPRATQPQHGERMRAVLSSDGFVNAFADAVQLRIDSMRLRRDDAVDSTALVAIFLNSVAIEPSLVSRTGLESWCLSELKLEVSDKGADRGDKQALSLGARLAESAAAMIIGAAGVLTTARSNAPSDGGSRRMSTVDRRGSGGESAAGRRKSIAHRAAESIMQRLKTEQNGPSVRATWRELVAALRTKAAALKAAGGSNGAELGEFGTRPAPNVEPAGLVARLLRAVGLRGKAVVGGDQTRPALVFVAKPWYVVSHVSATYRNAHRCFLVFFAWELLVQPLTLAFWEQTRTMDWLFYLSIALDMLYLARMLLRFNVTFVNAKSVIIYDPPEIRKHYLATEFAYDLLFTAPINFLGILLGAPDDVYVSIRLLRLGLCRELWRSYKEWEKRQADNDLYSGLLRFLSILILAAHMAACVWNALGFEYDGKPVASDLARDSQVYADVWPGQFNSLFVAGGAEPAVNDFLAPGSPEVLLGRRYCVSFFLCLSMLSALGINQLPANFMEIGFYLSMTIGNMTIFAWTVGQISALVMKQDDEIVTKRSQLELVHAYLTHIDVPAELKAQVESFFHLRLRDASFSSVRDEDIAAAMPIALQIEVSKHTNRGLVSEAALLNGCSDAFMDRLSSLLRERAIEPETLLFREGEVCKELFFIESGTVELSSGAVGRGDDEEAEVTLAIAGDTVGELPFVFGIRHFRNARSASETETRVFVLNTDNYRVLLKSFPQQEDKVMDNAMQQYDGMLTSRSGKSKVSAKSGMSSGGASEMGASAIGVSMAMSVTGSLAPTAAAQQVEEEQVVIEKVIMTAKKRREDLVVVRLCDAAHKGNVEKMQRLLSSNRVDVNKGDYDKRRPIHLAACGGHVRVIELLIVAQADINVKDRYQGTPLADALRHQQTEAAELLRKYGGVRDSAGIAEHLAFCAADPARVEELAILTRDKTSFVPDNFDARTALHIAAAVGNEEGVRVLIRSRADVNATDRRGRTPLQDAFFGKWDKCGRILLENGANMGSFDVATYMCYAAAADDLDTLHRLFRYRCSPNSADYDLRTPLHLAASNGRVAACATLLDQPGININAEDRFGNTALDDAMREQGIDQPIVVALFKARGLRVGSRRMFVPLTVQHAEEVKADEEAGQIEMQHSVALEAQRYEAWLSEQRAATTRTQKLVERILNVEHDREVLAESVPKWWVELQTFVDKHNARVVEMRDHIRPAITRWGVLAQENRFEVSMLADLEKRANFNIELYQNIARQMERLAEADFATKQMAARSEDGVSGSTKLWSSAKSKM